LEDAILGGHSKMVGLKDDVRVSSLPANQKIPVSDTEFEILGNYKVTPRDFLFFITRSNILQSLGGIS
jgi:hypothetical protein